MKLLLRKRHLLLLAGALWGLFSGSLYAQQTVSGTVTASEDGTLLVGVTVAVQGTNNGVLTDDNGRYKITAETPSAVLVFSYYGFATQEISISGQSSINVSLEPSISTLDEVVVVGYGSQKKRELTGAIVQLKSDEINKLATSDFASAIQGQMAGVSVRNGSGRPGENAQITIRGITSFQDGGSEPLYVVDGVTYVTNPNITPQEIESIEVLKDGASAAIYGSRASAGVILITTKKGRAGQPQVTFDAYYGIQSITSGIPLANTKEALYINDVQNRYQTTGQFYPLDFNFDALKHDTNWLDELQVDNAPMQNYSLGVSGGKGGLTYNVTGTFFDQTGTLILSRYKKYSLRSNTTFKKGKFTAQTNLGVNISDQTREPWALMYDAIRLNPYSPSLNPEEEEFTVGGTNPEVLTNFTGKLKQESNRNSNGLNGNLRLGLEIIKGLTLSANLGGSFNNTKDRFFAPSYTVFTDDGQINLGATDDNANLRLADGTSTRTIGEFTLNYQRTFGDHSLSALVGNTYETSRWEWYQTGADFVSSNSTPTIGNGEPIVGRQTINQTNSVSVLGRVFYSYKSKYMVNAVIRRDGSSNFGPNNRYGVFPSVSAAWTFSEEGFLSGIQEVLSLGKIRFGYGTTGSDRIPPYGYTPVVISNVSYPFGADESLDPGFTQPGFADPNLKWESNISRNIGLDLEFFKGKGGLTLDLYEQDKRDMLLAIVPPISAGSTPVSGQSYDRFLTNIGNLNNRGVEVGAFMTNRYGDFSYRLSGTFTKNINTVVSLSREDEIIFGGNPNIVRASQTNPVAALKEGLPVGVFLVYETDGTIKNAEELAQYQVLDPEAQLGDLRYVDTNGDGQLTLEDKVNKGSYQPAFEYGFNLDLGYKNIDFTVQFYGVEGSTIYNGPKQYAYSTKRHKDLVYAWTDANPTSNVPTPRSVIEHPNVQTDTDLFLEDGSFLRLRNVILGYSFPKTMLSKVGLGTLRIYVSAQNPITWTQYSGFDPEVASGNPFNGGLDQGKYPVSSIYRTGLTINF
ncbi:MAG: TonB-dependent receptor [Bacteroidota bacterium]